MLYFKSFIPSKSEYEIFRCGRGTGICSSSPILGSRCALKYILSSPIFAYFFCLENSIPLCFYHYDKVSLFLLSWRLRNDVNWWTVYFKLVDHVAVVWLWQNLLIYHSHKSVSKSIQPPLVWTILRTTCSLSELLNMTRSWWFGYGLSGTAWPTHDPIGEKIQG